MVNTTFIFANGTVDNTTVDVIVNVVEDFILEGTEDYVLTVQVMSGPASVSLDSISVTNNIVDNDGKYILFFT